MAGSNSAFNPAEFRTAIRDAMIMGQPNTISDRATFRWHAAKTYTTVDPGDHPYDLTAAPVVTTTKADVQIPVAVEFSARLTASGDTAIGRFDASQVTLTILDEDYALVEGANEVLLGGNRYEIQFVAPPLGLFEVTVYQVYCTAMDES